MIYMNEKENFLRSLRENITNNSLTLLEKN